MYNKLNLDDVSSLNNNNMLKNKIKTIKQKKKVTIVKKNSPIKGSTLENNLNVMVETPSIKTNGLVEQKNLMSHHLK
jgi:hypothetical protein